MWYKHTSECLSAFKQKETPTHITTWRNTKAIILSEISLPQKDNCSMIPLTEVPGTVTLMETESRMGVLGPGAPGDGGVAV